MIRGKPLEPQVYEPEHIARVMREMRTGFVGYFRTFVEQPLTPVFKEAIEQYQKEQPRYVDYLDLEALSEFEDSPSGLSPTRGASARSSSGA